MRRRSVFLRRSRVTTKRHPGSLPLRDDGRFMTGKGRVFVVFRLLEQRYSECSNDPQEYV